MSYPNVLPLNKLLIHLVNYDLTNILSRSMDKIKYGFYIKIILPLELDKVLKI